MPTRYQMLPESSWSSGNLIADCLTHRLKEYLFGTTVFR